MSLPLRPCEAVKLSISAVARRRGVYCWWVAPGIKYIREIIWKWLKCGERHETSYQAQSAGDHLDETINDAIEKRRHFTSGRR